MGKDIAHPHYYIPWCVGMFRTVGFGKMVNGFTNGKNVIDDCIAHHIVCLQIFISFIMSITSYIVSGCCYVLQSYAVFKRFSHISNIYLG